MNRKEVSRQAVHCSGIFTILAALYIGKFLVGLGALAVSAFVFFLSWWVKKKGEFRKRLPFRVKEIEELEDQTHEMLNRLERERVLKKWPYFGAFTFFMGMGISLLVFPLEPAILAIAVISVSDAASTLIGVHLGSLEIPYNRSKSLEGSSAFLGTSLIIGMFFLEPGTALLLALVATFTESLPEVNDNLSVPVVVGILVSLL